VVVVVNLYQTSLSDPVISPFAHVFTVSGVKLPSAGKTIDVGGLVVLVVYAMAKVPAYVLL
jgi:hypothetical protein